MQSENGEKKLTKIFPMDTEGARRQNVGEKKGGDVGDLGSDYDKRKNGPDGKREFPAEEKEHIPLRNQVEKGRKKGKTKRCEGITRTALVSNPMGQRS